MGIFRLNKPFYLSSLIFICFAFLILARYPGIILEGGRFWAEEGSLYFYVDWYFPWYESWFTAHCGYINFATSFAGWTAMRIGGIGYAPAFTTLTALLIQCLPVYVIMTHEFPWRHSTFKTFLAVLVCALPPLTGEVWLNTLQGQFHLALCSALILAAPPKRRAFYLVDGACLLLASLSGNVTCFLFPLFAVMVAVERNRRASINAIILGIGTIIQFVVYLVHDTSMRGGFLSFDALLSVISLHTFILQTVGFTLTTQIAGYISAAYAAHHFLWLGVLIFMLFYGALAVAIWRDRSIPMGFLLVASLTLSLFAFYEALGGDFNSFMTLEFGERYAFVPMTLNGLIIAGLASSQKRWISGFFSLWLCLLIFIGGADYRIDSSFFNNGPDWRAQMPGWRKIPVLLCMYGRINTGRRYWKPTIRHIAGTCLVIKLIIMASTNIQHYYNN